MKLDNYGYIEMEQTPHGALHHYNHGCSGCRCQDQPMTNGMAVSPSAYCNEINVGNMDKARNPSCYSANMMMAINNEPRYVVPPKGPINSSVSMYNNVIYPQANHPHPHHHMAHPHHYLSQNNYNQSAQRYQPNYSGQRHLSHSQSLDHNNEPMRLNLLPYRHSFDHHQSDYLENNAYGRGNGHIGGNYSLMDHHRLYHQPHPQVTQLHNHYEPIYNDKGLDTNSIGDGGGSSISYATVNPNHSMPTNNCCSSVSVSGKGNSNINRQNDVDRIDNPSSRPHNIITNGNAYLNCGSLGNNSIECNDNKLPVNSSQTLSQGPGQHATYATVNKSHVQVANNLCLVNTRPTISTSPSVGQHDNHHHNNINNNSYSNSNINQNTNINSDIISHMNSKLDNGEKKVNRVYNCDDIDGFESRRGIVGNVIYANDYLRAGINPGCPLPSSQPMLMMNGGTNIYGTNNYSYHKDRNYIENNNISAASVMNSNIYSNNNNSKLSDSNSNRNMLFTNSQQQMLTTSHLPHHHNHPYNLQNYIYAGGSKGSYPMLAADTMMAATPMQPPMQCLDNVIGNFDEVDNVPRRRRRRWRDPASSSAMDDYSPSYPKDQDGVGSFESWNYVFKNLERNGYGKDGNSGEMNDIDLRRLQLDEISRGSGDGEYRSSSQTATDTPKNISNHLNKNDVKRDNGSECKETAKQTKMNVAKLEEKEQIKENHANESRKTIKVTNLNSGNKINLNSVSKTSVKSKESQQGQSMSKGRTNNDGKSANMTKGKQLGESKVQKKTTTSVIVATNPVKEEEEWSCRFCTFLNPNTKRICDACFHSKDFDLDAVPTVSAPTCV